ncbi:hypothetical protein FSS13T_27350 [Flavobacterium saliperosum S13]|uniref:Uncharacterized protein n=1 Tax=Flavobacterium saliperosum S13 TaxID=1341155 RepID=A0ABN0QCY7_9FLAO|nr:hypothetical protein [Flavobacterium saliperosum]ESU21146.1 hypothetical protein FSS13T_27350 [Flavobacterium saliperosum S13]
MIKIIYLIFLFLSFNFKCFAQSDYPFYEQIAFDFYKDEILKNLPVKKKITVYKSLNYNAAEEIHYVPSNGLKTKVPQHRDSIKKIDFSRYWKSINANRFELNLTNIDKKQFKIKKSNNGSFPKVFVHYPKIYKDRVFIIVHQKYENSGTYYTIEFDENGKIIDWCKSIYETVTIY